MRRKGRIVVPALADLSAALLLQGATVAFRRLPRNTALSVATGLARTIGPRLIRGRIGRENLHIAFPEMSERKREEILIRMWENFARSLIEYLHVGATFDRDPANPESGKITVSGAEVFEKLRDEGKPAIIFTAHLANWELLGVCAAKYKLDVASLFRPPTNRHVAKRLFRARSGHMGRLVASRPGVSLELAGVLEAGGVVGLLVDQRFHGGVTVPFFGRLADTNPLLAKLARQYDCPVHGARAIRLPDGRIHLEITDAVDLPRDASGHIHVAGATAAVQAIVESWIREFPDQWMWVHQRWKYGRKTQLRPEPSRVPATQTD